MQKRAKCWVNLVWYKSCFVSFGITKVESITHQGRTKHQQEFTKQWDNGFLVDGSERLQTHTHTHILWIADNILRTFSILLLLQNNSSWHSVHLCTWAKYLYGPLNAAALKILQTVIEKLSLIIQWAIVCITLCIVCCMSKRTVCIGAYTATLLQVTAFSGDVFRHADFN